MPNGGQHLLELDKACGQHQSEALVYQVAAQNLITRMNLGGQEDMLEESSGSSLITRRIKTMNQDRGGSAGLSTGMVNPNPG